jgi:serine/threonine-protein kinase
MGDPAKDSPARLEIQLARHIDEVCRRFEADLRAGHRPRVEDYFGEFTGDARDSLALELEALESELREAAREAGIVDAPTIAPGFPPTLPEPGEAISSVHDAATLPPRADATVDLASSAQASSEAATPSHVRYFGDYEIIRELARGGMGVVFEARQTSLNRKVALKMILAGQLANDTDVKRFYSEAEAAANLDHPGIVPIFEVGQHEGQHYFSMGFVEGRSLSQHLADGPLPPREASDLIRRVSEAIEYAHQQGVIHRDLKPANILIDRSGNPRVTDFGLAKKIQSDSGLTGSGQIMGTPSYMPPEQAGGM